uniref:Sorting nexin-33 n=1 Tax=Phallusia mammillata TaxID=59560 RepID=A0A6F9DTX3_9ASCI|nr:sorting nexin-33 [Phallusia mammillata]
MEKVKTLYDFDGDTENGELSFSADEIITVTNKDIGDGWWEGQRADGTTGLFPETYVEACDMSQTAAPVLDLPPPPIQKSQSEKLETLGDEKPWGDPAPTQEQQPPVASDGNDWADDWDSSAPAANYQQPPSPTKSHQSLGISEASPTKRTDRKTTIKVGMNLLSTFTKTPAEAYILGECKAELGDTATSHIVLADVGPMWENSPEPFSCAVSNPVKESKFSGFKSFIAYNITPSHTDTPVQRRFKHFDWLYEQLNKKYNVTIAIPQLPDKQITGRYEDEFIEARRAQLQSWICRIALHPVVSRSEVFKHFITSKDDERAWKAGKRKAERDEAVGGAFLLSVEPPPNTVDLVVAEQTLDTHTKFTRSMDESCKQIMIIGQEQIKCYQGAYKQENQKFALALNSLSQSFELDERPVSQPLTDALKQTSFAFESIGKMYGEQAKSDWYPLLEGINEYKGVLATFPNILGNEKSVLDKQKDVRRLQLENKVTSDEMDDVTLRTEKVAYCVQAEVNHFQHYRVGDFAMYMKDFLAAQIAFHQKIVETLQKTAEHYKSMVPE